MKSSGNTPQTPAFDFDEWKRLAETDPEAFERRRREAVAAVIATAPARAQSRLEGLQWRVDMERRRAGNPTMALLRIYRMMWDSVYGEKGLANAWSDRAIAEVLRPVPAKKGGERNIVRLRPRIPETVD